jgi:hypothetical protein
MSKERDEVRNWSDLAEKGSRVIDGSGSKSPPPPKAPAGLARAPSNAGTNGSSPSSGDAAPVKGPQGNLGGA